MSPLEIAELQARARLLLSSAGMPSAVISVGCDASGAWLVWRDGARIALSVTGSLVESALDAIEARLSSVGAAGTGPADAGGAAEPPGGAVHAAPLPPSVTDDRATPTIATAGSSASLAPAEPGASADSNPAHPQKGALDGGVSLATVTEFWSGDVGFGPRLDVGVNLGGPWSVVVAEGARFGASGSSMLFDLQAGVAYGAPYATRTGVGAVALAGAERQASGGGGGLWGWSFTGSLGLRASLASGPVDVWLGADLMARSHTIDSPKEGIPQLTGQLTLGFLVPAFSPRLLARAGADLRGRRAVSPAALID